MQLIGNAVPPLLASKIAEAVRESLRSAMIGTAPGALLSFVPTLSKGMSPALERAARLVRAHFPESTSTRLQADLWL